MAATVEELIVNNLKPVTVCMASSAVEAFSLMLEHDFSQLPIIDEENHQQGIVSAEGILKSIRNFGSSLDELLVQHAVEEAATASPQDDVFEVFEKFDKYAVVLIVDNQNKLLGIITPWDTAAYLQRRAEDSMLVEDIESRLKEHVQAAFTNPDNGQLDQVLLSETIQRMVDNTESNYKTIERCLKQYLGRNSISHKPSRETIEASFADSIFSTLNELTFDDLTFYQYTELLLNKDRWLIYGKRFGLDANRVRKLLDDVRETRNKLAHFRGEIINEERERLRFCRDWLERHPIPDFEAVMLTKNIAEITPVIEVGISPTDEELSPTESRYAKLALYLQGLPRSNPRIVLSFDRIEEILEGPLPPSAWEHRSWWANDSVSHVQSQQWLDAGWRVASINMTNHQVTFLRNKEREELYIKFFSALLIELHNTNFPAKSVSPSGASWITVLSLPRNRAGKGAFYNFSFTHNKRFRVELYIDTQAQAENHLIFDNLFEQKSEIENEFGSAISWERLDTKRASRIAIYHDGHINDSDERLAKLLDWAVASLILFDSVLTQRIEVAFEAIL